MKKFLLGTAALVALGVPAMAADMAVRPIARPAPYFSWTGCYIGANIGYATGTSKHSAEPGSVLVGPASASPFGAFPAPGPGVPAPTLAATSPFPQAPFAFGQGADITDPFHLGGMIAGGTVGCQIQAGAWVFGIEGDGGPSDKEGQDHDKFPFNPQYVNQTQERWQATLRARIGYAVDKWLFYATGGVAWAGVEASAEFSCNTVQTTSFGTVFPGCGNAVAGPFTTGALATAQVGLPSIHDTKTMVGYSVGAGTEYSIGYGWSIKSEYIYMKFADKDFFNRGTPSCCFVPTFVSPTKVSLDNHTFKWGLNYSFNLGKAPVAVTK